MPESKDRSTMTIQEKRAAFKKMVMEGERMPVLVGVFDGITARLAEVLGYDGCIMGGQAVAASTMGVPDIGLVTESEQMNRAYQLAQCVDLPFIADADTGYGNVLNVRRTLADLENFGIYGAHFEDQVTPKRCGAMGGVQVEPVEVGIQKIETLVKYRKDPNFLIIARTDAGEVYDLDEAIRRSKLYYEAGADMVFYGGILQSLDEIRKFVDETCAPVFFVLMECSRQVCFNIKDIAAAGVRMTSWPNGLLMRWFKAAHDLMKNFKETGDTLSHYDQLIPIEECNKLMKIQDWNPPGMFF